MPVIILEYQIESSLYRIDQVVDMLLWYWFPWLYQNILKILKGIRPVPSMHSSKSLHLSCSDRLARWSVLLQVYGHQESKKFWSQDFTQFSPVNFFIFSKYNFNHKLFKRCNIIYWNSLYEKMSPCDWNDYTAAVY